MVLLIFLCALSLSVYARESFGCYIVDTHGQDIHGYYSEKDELWYLFVPSTETVETLDLHVDGDVTEVSSGVLNIEDGVITAPFAQSRALTLTCAGEEITVVVKQSDLPSLHIVLADASLNQVHANKDRKFQNNSIFLSDPDGEHDLVVKDSVELKGRGNTSWKLYEKKGYQIKFDSKTSVMGMGKAKKWVLLSNASDDSMMRTQLTYQMAAQMDMPFVPSFEYIELWINGEYRGTYILGEKIELGSSRLDLHDPMGGLFEHDEDYYEEEDYWFYSDVLGRHFVLKEFVEEDDDTVIQALMEHFQGAVDGLSEYLYSTPASEVTLDGLSAMIDVDSFIQYYLINEFVLNREALSTSFYWHQDGPQDVIHLGPIWDYDTCMGNDSGKNTENYADGHILFRYLLAIPEFYERTQQLLQVYMPLFEAMDSNIDVLYEQIRASAEMNYLRWDVLGKPDPKEGGEDFHDTYEETVEALRAWLAGREVHFSVPRTQSVACAVSEDCQEMLIRFQEQQPYHSVKFAVWSEEDGQNDLTWYTAAKDDRGVWCASVDLTWHNSAGIYRVDVYADDAVRATVSGQGYVETARTPDVWIDVETAPDCTTMELMFRDTQRTHEQIIFAVWSEEGGQDDLRWYPALEQETGEWACTVDLAWHNSAGNYHVHAYSEEDGAHIWTALRNVYVEQAVGSPRLEPEVLHSFSRDNTKMTLKLINAEDAAQQVWFAVWSEEKGQDDIAWYRAEKNGSMWTAQVDLIDHDSVGLYQVHVYGGSGRPEEPLTFTVVDVPAPLVLPPSLRVYVDEQYLTLEVRNVPRDQQLWLPVWTEENGQDDIAWYRPWLDERGVWWLEVPLRNHGAGTCHIHVYGGLDGPTELLDYDTVEVQQVSGPRLTAEISGTSMVLELRDIPSGQQLWLPVWSGENGQDDIVWYRPQLYTDGVWRCWVDLSGHGSNGTYYIHAYQGTSGPSELIDYTTVEVEGVTGLTVTTEAQTGIMTILLNAAEAFERIWIPVWSEENGQDDIVWYEPENINGLQWRVDVDMSSHALSGTYHIHVYCGGNGPEALVTYTTAAV